MNSQAQTQTQTAPTFQYSSSTGSLLGSVSGALALILLLIVAIAWVARRSGFVSTAAKGKNILAIKCSQALGQRERVVIVEVGERWLVLGVTPSSITCLVDMVKDESGERGPVTNHFQNTLMDILKNNKPESGS